MTDSEQFHEARKHFHALVDLAPAERAQALAQLQESQPEFARQLYELFTHFDAADLQAPALNDAPFQANTAPKSIGPFEIIGLLGQGGMGEVYEARRTGVDFDQHVAIKVVRTPLLSRIPAQRFQRERAILARLMHPNIAHLIEGGVEPDQGASWFAMELIHGKSITDWADSGELSIERRIQLLLEVLDAVQFAHTNLIVHRDLKPSNVWVNTQGHVKLLDFGIAKLIDPEHSNPEASIYALTPNYSAPEQREQRPITTSVDIFLVGLLMRELLTGVAPKVEEWQDRTELPGPIEIYQKLTLTEQARIAKIRGVSAQRLTQLLRRDLAAIIAKATARMPQDRYASAASFANDLHAYLAHQPVLAARSSVLNILSKLIRRNRLASTIAAISLIALISISLVAMQRARSEARERERAEVVLGFMRSVFAQGDPQQTGGKALSAAELLDRAAEAMLKRQDFDARTRARIALEVAGVFLALGEPQKALTQAQLALTSINSDPSSAGKFWPFSYDVQADPELSSQIQYALSQAQSELGDWDRVVETINSALADKSGLSPELHARLLIQRSWSQYMLGDAQSAEAGDRAAIALVEQDSRLNELQARALSELASIISDQGDSVSAIKLLKKAIAIGDGAPNRMQLDSYIDQFSLAREYFRSGDVAQARNNLDLLIPKFDTLVGPGHDRTVMARNLLAQCFMRVGNNAAGLAELEISEQALAKGNSPASLANLRLIRGKLLLYSRQAKAAKTLLGAAIAQLQITPENSNFIALRARWLYAESQLQLGEFDAAKAALIRIVTQLKAANQNPTAALGEALDSLGRSYLLTGEYAKADTAFAQAQSEITGSIGDKNLAALRVRIHQLWLAYISHNDPDALAKLKVFRGQLEALPGEHTIQIAEFDLLIATLEPAPSKLESSRKKAAQSTLQRLSGEAGPPNIYGLTSDS